MESGLQAACRRPSGGGWQSQRVDRLALITHWPTVVRDGNPTRERGTGRHRTCDKSLAHLSGDRPIGDQGMSRLKAGLQPGRLGLPSHNAELISGLSLSREVGRFSPSPIMGKSDVPNKSRGLRNRPEIESRFAMSASRRLQLLRSDFDPSHHRFCDLLTASPTTASPTTASSRQAAEQRQSTIER